MPTRPMLAGTIEEAKHLSQLAWPMLASPKLDGIRCLIHPQLGPVTRTFKPIPNRFIHNALVSMGPELSYLDGELLTLRTDGSEEIFKDFNGIQSDVMSYGGAPEFQFHVFDDFTDINCPFNARILAARNRIRALRKHTDFIECVHHVEVINQEEFLFIASAHLDMGYEGTMLRSMDGPYKSGRSTFKQQWLLKWKPLEDAEAVIIGFEELERNVNEQTMSVLGLSKRSSHKAGKVKGGTLGKLLVRNCIDNEEFAIGTGFDNALRDTIWKDQDTYMGLTVCYKYQKFGMKNKPRQPSFKGFRFD